MLTLKELDNIIKDDYYHPAIKEIKEECTRCYYNNIPVNLYVYSFGDSIAGIYWECANCVEASRLEFPYTIIRPIVEQELFYLRCHI